MAVLVLQCPDLGTMIQLIIYSISSAKTTWYPSCTTFFIFSFLFLFCGVVCGFLRQGVPVALEPVFELALVD